MTGKFIPQHPSNTPKTSKHQQYIIQTCAIISPRHSPPHVVCLGREGDRQAGQRHDFFPRSASRRPQVHNEYTLATEKSTLKISQKIDWPAIDQGGCQHPLQLNDRAHTLPHDSGENISNRRKWTPRTAMPLDSLPCVSHQSYLHFLDRTYVPRRISSTVLYHEATSI